MVCQTGTRLTKCILIVFCRCLGCVANQKIINTFILNLKVNWPHLCILFYVSSYLVLEIHMQTSRDMLVQGLNAIFLWQYNENKQKDCVVSQSRIVFMYYWIFFAPLHDIQTDQPVDFQNAIVSVFFAYFMNFLLQYVAWVKPFITSDSRIVDKNNNYQDLPIWRTEGFVVNFY